MGISFPYNVKIKFILIFLFPVISTSLIQEAIDSLLQTLLVFEVGPKTSITILRVGVIVSPDDILRNLYFIQHQK